MTHSPEAQEIFDDLGGKLYKTLRYLTIINLLAEKMGNKPFPTVHRMVNAIDLIGHATELHGLKRGRSFGDLRGGGYYEGKDDALKRYRRQELKPYRDGVHRFPHEVKTLESTITIGDNKIELSGEEAANKIRRFGEHFKWLWDTSHCNKDSEPRKNFDEARYALNIITQWIYHAEGPSLIERHLDRFIHKKWSADKDNLEEVIIDQVYPFLKAVYNDDLLWEYRDPPALTPDTDEPTNDLFDHLRKSQKLRVKASTTLNILTPELDCFGLDPDQAEITVSDVLARLALAVVDKDISDDIAKPIMHSRTGSAYWDDALKQVFHDDDHENRLHFEGSIGSDPERTINQIKRLSQHIHPQQFGIEAGDNDDIRHFVDSSDCHYIEFIEASRAVLHKIRSGLKDGQYGLSAAMAVAYNDDNILPDQPDIKRRHILNRAEKVIQNILSDPELDNGLLKHIEVNSPETGPANEMGKDISPG
jgi:hypothetical protein